MALPPISVSASRTTTDAPASAAATAAASPPGPAPTTTTSVSDTSLGYSSRPGGEVIAHALDRGRPVHRSARAGSLRTRLRRRRAAGRRGRARRFRLVLGQRAPWLGRRLPPEPTDAAGGRGGGDRAHRARHRGRPGAAAPSGPPRRGRRRRRPPERRPVDPRSRTRLRGRRVPPLRDVPCRPGAPAGSGDRNHPRRPGDATPVARRAPARVPRWVRPGRRATGRHAGRRPHRREGRAPHRRRRVGAARVGRPPLVRSGGRRDVRARRRRWSRQFGASGLHPPAARLRARAGRTVGVRRARGRSRRRRRPGRVFHRRLHPGGGSRTRRSSVAWPRSSAASTAGGAATW